MNKHKSNASNAEAINLTDCIRQTTPYIAKMRDDRMSPEDKAQLEAFQKDVESKPVEQLTRLQALQSDFYQILLDYDSGSTVALGNSARRLAACTVILTANRMKTVPSLDVLTGRSRESRLVHRINGDLVDRLRELESEYEKELANSKAQEELRVEAEVHLEEAKQHLVDANKTITEQQEANTALVARIAELEQQAAAHVSAPGPVVLKPEVTAEAEAYFNEAVALEAKAKDLEGKLHEATAAQVVLEGKLKAALALKTSPDGTALMQELAALESKVNNLESDKATLLKQLAEKPTTAGSGNTVTLDCKAAVAEAIQDVKDGVIEQLSSAHELLGELKTRITDKFQKAMIDGVLNTLEKASA